MDAMNEQDSRQETALQRPTNDDKKAWKAYWEEQDQSWRTEPEIDTKRQVFLTERRKILPDIEQGLYPFKDIKLDRGDVEWLLATHKNGHGQINHPTWEHARGVDLRGADLRGIFLSRLPLTQLRAGLQRDEWYSSTSEQREAAAIHLEGAILDSADLTWATLRSAHLEGTSLVLAHLEGATLRGAHLEGADLRLAYLDNSTILHGVTLSNHGHGSASVADVSWNGVNLVVIDWATVTVLGDEQRAHQQRMPSGTAKDTITQLNEYREAVRANRQLAVVLRTQGLTEEADQFAYRAQLLQREVWRRQRRILKYALSWFLYLIAGYGYRPIRSVIWYLVIIFGFAMAYFSIGHLPPVPDAFVFSLTSFHGRGFFPGLGNETSLHNPLVVLAAIEAVIGLFIEISFIATFTQRFFAK